MAATVSTLTYADAIARIATLEQTEQAEALNPKCRGFALTHGAPAARATLLLHGYTNCPQQFRAFAARLHARGQNVYVPRLPHHGLADRLSAAHALIGRRELLAYLDDALAVAHGLGAEVGVLGISAGGVLAAYGAQHRPDVARAVIVAPVLGTPGVADWAVTPLAAVAGLLPNQFRWWDPQLRDARRGPTHAYPRFSTRALASIVGLGRSVLRDARRRPPAARSIALVTNAADQAVTLSPAERLAAAWARHGAALRTYHFGPELGLIHDVIDPDQERQQIDLVYPVLLDLVDG
jgi:pimeloyl-ACP methyl ester carboxylesterase